jgi:hypothetical protein
VIIWVERLLLSGRVYAVTHSLADEGISPGLILWGQGRNTGDRIVQTLSIASGLIGMSQHGLNVEHNLWIRRS